MHCYDSNAKRQESSRKGGRNTSYSMHGLLRGKRWQNPSLIYEKKWSLSKLGSKSFWLKVNMAMSVRYGGYR
jgi:hypothetical protein